MFLKVDANHILRTTNNLWYDFCCLFTRVSYVSRQLDLPWSLCHAIQQHPSYISPCHFTCFKNHFRSDATLEMSNRRHVNISTVNDLRSNHTQSCLQCRQYLGHSRRGTYYERQWWECDTYLCQKDQSFISVNSAWAANALSHAIPTLS